MPRRKIVKYPEVLFDKNKQFPLESFQFPSIFEISSMTDMQIISHYQKHFLVHKFCPNTKCRKFNLQLVLNSTGALQCPVCTECFPSRPKVLKNLSGNHKFLYTHIYSFCLGHDQKQGMNFLGAKSQNGGRLRNFRRRMQSVIIQGLKTEDKKLGGGVFNPVMTDEMQKGRRRKGNGSQKSHPTIVHGDVVGACDNERYRFDMTPKKHPGPPRLEQIENTLENWLLPNSTLMTDGAKCYITFQDKYPDLVTYLIQLNHSVGEWTRRVTVEGEKITATTNKMDGAWSHLRRFLSNHMVSQSDAFRYLKEFEFIFGAWAKAQNGMERLLNYMQLESNLLNTEGPKLAAPWRDLSKSNILNIDQARYFL
jgi:hypothetical protein